MKPEAVIFDFDGVIVDTEHLHYAAFNEVLGPRGLAITWDEYVETYIGFDDRGAFQARYERAGRALPPAEQAALVEGKAAAFHRSVSTEPPTPFPGVLELIRNCAGAVPLALCTGALRSDIAPVFASLRLHGLFDLVVTADDVPMSKPDPACYRLAVERLAAHHGRALDPATCLAIEDTPAGITAAKGAGLRVLALTNSYDREFLSLADYVRDSLEAVKLETLQGWMG